MKSNRSQAIALQPLYDVAEATLANVTAERTDFIDSMVVTLSTPMPGATVHYTLDGTEPTSESQVFDYPIVLRETTDLKARAILASADDSFVSNIAFTKLVPRDASTLVDPTPGVRCRYYEGEWFNLPNFDTLTVQTDQVIERVMIPDFAQDEDYGLVITGYVKVPEDGLYDIYINSDDGSALYIGDELLADNDGVHGPQEIGGGVALAAGLHPFTVLMFQRKGGEFLELSIEGPGLEKQPVSADMLFHDRGTISR
jgi:hexosaminidase